MKTIRKEKLRQRVLGWRDVGRKMMETGKDFPSTTSASVPAMDNVILLRNC